MFPCFCLWTRESVSYVFTFYSHVGIGSGFFTYCTLTSLVFLLTPNIGNTNVNRQKLKILGPKNIHRNFALERLYLFLIICAVHWKHESQSYILLSYLIYVLGLCLCSFHFQNKVTRLYFTSLCYLIIHIS